MYFVDSWVSGAKSGTVNTVVTVPCATPLTVGIYQLCFLEGRILTWDVFSHSRQQKELYNMYIIILRIELDVQESADYPHPSGRGLSPKGSDEKNVRIREQSHIYLNHAYFSMFSSFSFSSAVQQELGALVPL